MNNMNKNRIHNLLSSNRKKGKRFLNGNRMVVIGMEYRSMDDDYGTIIYELHEPGKECVYTKDLEIATDFLYAGNVTSAG